MAGKGCHWGCHWARERQKNCTPWLSVDDLLPQVPLGGREGVVVEQGEGVLPTLPVGAGYALLVALPLSPPP